MLSVTFSSSFSFSVFVSRRFFFSYFPKIVAHQVDSHASQVLTSTTVAVRLDLKAGCKLIVGIARPNLYKLCYHIPYISRCERTINTLPIKIGHAAEYLTEFWAILEPPSLSINEIYVVRKRRSTDFGGLTVVKKCSAG